MLARTGTHLEHGVRTIAQQLPQDLSDDRFVAVCRFAER